MVGKGNSVVLAIIVVVAVYLSDATSLLRRHLWARGMPGVGIHSRLTARRWTHALSPASNSDCPLDLLSVACASLCDHYHVWSLSPMTRSIFNPRTLFPPATQVHAPFLRVWLPRLPCVVLLQLGVERDCFLQSKKLIVNNEQAAIPNSNPLSPSPSHIHRTMKRLGLYGRC